MSTIPREVLSEHFQKRLEKRKLVSALFLTYTFDPGFFEQEILPVFLDQPFSHVSEVRLVQMEDALRELPGKIAVYYDDAGIQQTESGSAKLDVARIPVRHSQGIFHAKNVFLLVHDEDNPEDVSLIIACMSANLTRSGWWENVEVCHVEEIFPGEKTRLRDDLRSFFRRLKRLASSSPPHEVLDEMQKFLSGVTQHRQRSTGGRIFPHFYAGQESVLDFLRRTGGSNLRGCDLEVLSPFFDKANKPEPLEDIVREHHIRSVRIQIPENERGEFTCAPAIESWISRHPKFEWGSLPKTILSMGKTAEAGTRFVHAKVYRFFGQRPRREYLFIGSPNATKSGHQKAGNVETGFFVEVTNGRPKFWLETAEDRKRKFKIETEEGDHARYHLVPLQIVYSWKKNLARVFWGEKTKSPALTLLSAGVQQTTLPPLKGQLWTQLSTEVSEIINGVLETTSFLDVRNPDGEQGTILIQEEDMHDKPSLLFDLTIEQILRYWALLTPEQRASYLENVMPTSALSGDGSGLVPLKWKKEHIDTLFGRFAGYFHAFGSLERSVVNSLEEGKERVAIYRLFGQKYDSLGRLLTRTLEQEDVVDNVDRYVIMLCAHQLVESVAAKFPKFWESRSEEVEKLERLIERRNELRRALVEKDPKSMAAFLDWFDPWFVSRAQPLEEASS
jgi:hypothetical protein